MTHPADRGTSQGGTSALAVAQARYRTAQQIAQDWPQKLGEGIAALTSDLEFELRSRVRGVLADAEVCIDRGDPVRHRDELERWLRDRLVFEATREQALLVTGVHRIGEQMALLAGTGERRSPAPPPSPEELVGSLSPLPDAGTHGTPLTARVMTVAMPTYGGSMMALVVSRYVGLHLSMALVGGIAGLLAVLMGGSALAGDRSRMLDRRRGEAKMAVRSHVDDFSSAMTKQVRDTLRAWHAELRTATAAGVTARLQEARRELEAEERLADAERDRPPRPRTGRPDREPSGNGRDAGPAAEQPPAPATEVALRLVRG
jgi:hypothetical protein